MDISEQLTLLAELNAIEKKIAQKRITLETRPADAKKAQVDADAVKESVAEVDRKRFEVEKERRSAELEMHNEKDNLKKWSVRADNIRGEREYTALQSEIGGLKRTISRIEERVLERMQQIEEFQIEIEKRTKAWEEAEVLAKEEWSKVDDELRALRGELNGLEKGRDGMLESLPGDLVKRYRRIANKRGDGVAMIENDSVCGSCRITVRPQLVLQVYRGELIETCEGCARILVHPKSTHSKEAEAAVADATKA